MNRAAWSSFAVVCLAAGCGEEQTCLGTEPAPADTGEPAECTAHVVIGMYGDDKCTPGEEVLTVEFDVGEPCVGWSRDAGLSTRYNSASRFQCWSDRVCYSQHTDTCSCDPESPASFVTDKEARSDKCIADDTPGIWLKVLSGTDGCPEPPEGFACPASEPGEGSAELAGACEG